MKYRALCPSCGYRFGRLWFFRVVPEYHHACPGCGARIKSESLSEWAFSALAATPVIVAIALWLLLGMSPWLIALAAAVAVIVGLGIFPFVTKFELKAQPKSHHPQAASQQTTP